MKYFIHIIIPLLLGSIVYEYSRTNELLINKWLPRLNQYCKYYELPNWVKFNLPDGLWLYSLSTLMIFIWGNKLNAKSIVWFLAGFILAILSELGQKFGYFPGTFDWIDIVFYFLAISLSFAHFITPNKFKIPLTFSATKQVKITNYEN